MRPLRHGDTWTLAITAVLTLPTLVGGAFVAWFARSIGTWQAGR